MPSPIAVTGSTGALGGRVARLLAERGANQRLVVRDPARAPDLPSAEVATATYEDGPALTAALDGVEILFLVSGHEDRDRVALHRSAIEAAAAAGVRRIVYTSFMGAAPRASFPFAIDHHHTERLILEAGIELTALRSSLYADVAPWFVQDDVIRAPAGDGRLAWVTRRDIARVAVEALLDDAHAGHVYELSGPEPIDLHETARQLSRACGREIAYVPETPEEARASRRVAPPGEEPPPDWLVEGWVGSYLAIATGELAVTSHTVEMLTGERPWSLADLLEREPGSWAPLRR